MAALRGPWLNCAACWGCEMKKKTPAPTKVKTSALSKRKFIGTENPRHLRVIMALLVRPRPREEIDRIAGASNGPDEILRLRAKLDIERPCVRIPAFDRDGHDVQIGVYSLTTSDRRKISIRLSNRQAGAIDAALAGLITFAVLCAGLLLRLI